MVNGENDKFNNEDLIKLRDKIIQNENLHPGDKISYDKIIEMANKYGITPHELAVNVFESTEAQFRNIKKRSSNTHNLIILKPEIPKMIERAISLRNVIMQNEDLYEGSFIDYKVLQHISKKYNIPEKTLAIDVFKLADLSYYNIKRDQNRKAKILYKQEYKEKQNALKNEEINHLRHEILENEGLKIGDKIDYEKLSLLSKKYSFEEKKLAMDVLGISSNSLNHIKSDRNRKATILRGFFSDEELKELSDKILGKYELQPYDSIDYKMLQRISDEFYINERILAIDIFKLTETQYYNLKFGSGKRAYILKKEYKHKTPEELKELKLKIFEQEQLYIGKRIDYEEIENIQKKYNLKLDELLHILGITKDSHNFIKHNRKYKTIVKDTDTYLTNDQILYNKISELEEERKNFKIDENEQIERKKARNKEDKERLTEENKQLKREKKELEEKKRELDMAIKNFEENGTNFRKTTNRELDMEIENLKKDVEGTDTYLTNDQILYEKISELEKLKRKLDLYFEIEKERIQRENARNKKEEARLTKEKKQLERRKEELEEKKRNLNDEIKKFEKNKDRLEAEKIRFKLQQEQVTQVKGEDIKTIEKKPEIVKEETEKHYTRTDMDNLVEILKTARYKYNICLVHKGIGIDFDEVVPEGDFNIFVKTHGLLDTGTPSEVPESDIPLNYNVRKEIKKANDYLSYFIKKGIKFDLDEVIEYKKLGILPISEKDGKDFQTNLPISEFKFKALDAHGFSQDGYWYKIRKDGSYENSCLKYNPDGFAKDGFHVITNTRTNARGFDINRHYILEHRWSEDEYDPNGFRYDGTYKDTGELYHNGYNSFGVDEQGKDKDGNTPQEISFANDFVDAILEGEIETILKKYNIKTEEIDKKIYKATEMCPKIKNKITEKTRESRDILMEKKEQLEKLKTRKLDNEEEITRLKMEMAQLKEKINYIDPMYEFEEIL